MIVTYTVKAKYCGETLEPLEPLDELGLEEGAEVSLSLASVLPPYLTEPDDEWSGLDEVGRSIYERRNHPSFTDAVYCDGRFKPSRTLIYDEGEAVWLTIASVPPEELVPGQFARILYETRGVPFPSLPDD